MKNSSAGGVSRAFVWFHAISVNGGAMAIAATIATYFSLNVFMSAPLIWSMA